MSIRLMSLVWELNLAPGEKLVLLALADQANDNGTQCWPSVDTIAKRSGQTTRTVRRILLSLEEKGQLTRKHRDGTSNQYHVHPCHNVTPDKLSPLTKKTPTPDTMSPKPSRTTNNINNKGAHKIPANWEPLEFGPASKSRRIVDSWSTDDLTEHIERFTAHHRKMGSKFECWQSAWSTWVLNTEKFKKENDNGRGFQRRNGQGADKRSGLARAIDNQLGQLSSFP